jgi:GH24 family phage-related lysozyme (muramidase)
VKTSEVGKALIKKWEGCQLVGYLCPSGKPTIGYGHTGTVLSKPVKVGMKITQAHADKILNTDIRKFEREVNKYPHYTWSQNEFDALVSFAFNIGNIDQLTDFGARSKEVIAKKMLLYCNSKGVPLDGLRNRRLEEQKLFLTK